MGILISMPPKSKIEAITRQDIPVGGAKIMLFTGVRYERYGDSPIVQQKRTGPTRSRQPRRRA